MLYNDHWEEVKKRMTGYWQREAMDRCCAAIRVSKPGYQDFGEKNFYFDIDTADRMFRGRFENTYYIGEALPCLFPYFGTAGIAEYTGCKPNRTPPPPGLTPGWRSRRQRVFPTAARRPFRPRRMPSAVYWSCPGATIWSPCQTTPACWMLWLPFGERTT